jgi:hypothetical protein
VLTTKDILEPRNYTEYGQLREIWKTQFNERTPAKELVTDIEVDPTFHIESSSRDGQWVQGWVKDSNGTPIGFIKVANREERDGTGRLLCSGPALCDIEVNPAYKGRNAALALLRVVKDHYNAPHVWAGTTYSRKGYEMFLRMRGHEKATGETILKMKPYSKEEEVTPDQEDDYTFVKDWDNLIPKYHIY